MANYYCEYCGSKFSSVSSLTAGNCLRHPNGSNKGKHMFVSIVVENFQQYPV